MNDDLKCPRCGTAAQIVDGYNNCGTCGTMDPEQWIRDNQGASIAPVVFEVKNADGKTVEQVKAEADAAKAIKDKEDEDRFYEELIKKAKSKAPCFHVSLSSEQGLICDLYDNIRTKGVTSTMQRIEGAVIKYSEHHSGDNLINAKLNRIADIINQAVSQIAEVEAE